MEDKMRGEFSAGLHKGRSCSLKRNLIESLKLGFANLCWRKHGMTGEDSHIFRGINLLISLTPSKRILERFPKVLNYSFNEIFKCFMTFTIMLYLDTRGQVTVIIICLFTTEFDHGGIF